MHLSVVLLAKEEGGLVSESAHVLAMYIFPGWSIGMSQCGALSSGRSPRHLTLAALLFTYLLYVIFVKLADGLMVMLIL